MATTNIITQIWNGAVKDFKTAEAWITTTIAKVEAVLPGAAPVVADIKQLASDAIGVAAADEATFEPALVTGVETLADAALAKLAGPFALPLTPGTNTLISSVAAKAQAAIQAWALKAQSELAENNTTAGTTKTS